MRAAGVTAGLLVLISSVIPGTYAGKHGASRNGRPDGRAAGEAGAPTAAPHAALEGRVYDGRGRPVGGATIALAGSGFWPARSVETNASGYFEWPDIPPGVYELRASKGAWAAPALQGLSLDPGARRMFALVLERGWTLAGRVLDARDDRGVPNADITLVRGPLGLSTTQLTTDAHGRFELFGLLGGPHSLYVRADGYVQDGPLRFGAEDAPVTVRLEPAATLAGRIVDRLGRPIPGARVGVLGDEEAPRTALASPDSLGVTAGPVPPISAAGSALPLAGSEVTSSHEGRFSISGLRAGAYRVAVRHRDHAPEESEIVRVGVGDTVSGIQVVLHRGAELAGRVVDASGSGLEGIPVELRSDEERFARLTTTASDGSFVFRGARGTVRVTAMPFEMPPVRREIVIEDEALVTTELEMPSRLYTLHGRVVDESGLGVSGALVTVSSSSPKTPVRRTTKSDADGTFSVAALPEPPYELRAEHSSFSPASLDGLDRLEGVRVVLSAGVTLVGRVIDGWSRDGLSHVRVQLRGPESPETETRADGSFVFRQTPTGTYEVSFRHPEYEEQRRRIVVEPPGYVDRPQTIETIRLEPGGTIRGEVLDARNEPVPSAEVTWGDPPRWERAVLTDAQGKFQLRGVAEGTVWLSARHERAGEGSSLEAVTVRPRETTSGTFVRLPASMDD